ncbi:dehydratase [Flavobacterium sp. KMS]|uniref:NAD-dependent epimerase/dehydratase family protein n=1 Tax=Flavobacterium sp. KMS TaxID=1566023 RepID=UPI00057CBE3A|nr:NAD-dependent epimerase/dehydratase family protein [Flavobacterium sp. KMS]KIA99823.1 dehydratase [Flavobacterium sp. KMS]
MEIVITGASGFVGTNLSKYLRVFHNVHSMSVRYVVNQQFKIKGDALVHLAGKAHDLQKVSNPQEYYDANFELTKQLFDAFLNSEALVFIFMSTVKASADEVVGVLTEDRESNPKTHYGIAKQQAEEYILNKELPVGKNVYILRPCMIHGPGNKGNLNLLYQLVSKGLPWPLGAFENKRSFLSINNLCFVIKELLENENIPSGVYNVSDDTALSTNEVISVLGESLEKKVAIWKIPVNFIRRLAKIGDRIKLPLNSERLQKLTENYEVSNVKIKKVIPKELPISAKEGLLITFNSFK